MMTMTNNLLGVKLENIPGELQKRTQWVVWEPEFNPVTEKFDKIPHNPRNGHRASSTNPNDWATFDEAWAQYQVNTRWGGIGYVFSIDDPYAGIDLDDCLDPDTGKGTSADARAIVKALDSYAEASPSGTGVKIIVRATLDRARIDHDQGIEIYSAKRFFTITGHVFPRGPVDITENQAAFDELLTRFPERSTADHSTHSDYQARRVSTEALLNRAMNAENGERFRRLWSGDWESVKPSQSEADASLCRLLAFWTGPDANWIDELFRESGLYRPEKWERPDYRQSTIGKALEGLKDWYEWFPTVIQIGEGKASAESGAIGLSDFRAFMPDHKYIFTPSRELWPASSVNARIKPIHIDTNEDGEKVYQAANKWLDENQPVEQMTWAPGEPELVSDRLMSQGGWVERPGFTVFNLYRPPTVKLGEAAKATPWTDHLEFVYPDEYDHIIRWMAHRVQHPNIKINHALVLGGSQGIGKDTLLEPVKQSIGPWNFYEVNPTQLLGRFNNFVQSVILRVSEARDLGDVDRYTFYDHLKGYAASPPDVLRCDEKYMREYQVMNVCGVIITTNHLTGGLYLPPDDRRHFVAWSERSLNDFTSDYWTRLYQWYERGGYGHVAAYLNELDISDFDPKAPPEKTAAFWDTVSSNIAPEDAELADILDLMNWPDAITISEIAGKAEDSLREWMTERKNSRQIPHRIEEVGYIRVRNESARDGLWKAGGKRQVVYARKELDPRHRITAARELVGLYK